MKKVAIYVRVSTHDQAEEGYSVDEQIDKLTKFSEIKNWKVYDTYVDPGFTGSNIDRPSLSKLIRAAKQKRIDTVLVYKLDRLSRSQKDTLFLIEDVFINNGIDFVSLNENFDTSTPFGKAMIGILSVFAQLEREQITERMKMGKVGRAKSGKAMSWANIPFGYNLVGSYYEVNKLEASIVKRIYKQYASGISITKIRDHLNDEGHIGKDINWSYRTVRGILDNPIYAGYNKFKGDLYKGDHEAIITKEQFDDIQIELLKRQQQVYKDNNNPRPFQAKYLLSGIIKCGYCGAPLGVSLGNIRKDGSRLKKYQCYNRQPKRSRATIYNKGEKCDSGFYMMEDLEKLVLDQIEDIQLNPESISESTEQKEHEDFSQEYEERILKITKQMGKLSNLYLNDLLSMEEMQSKAKELQDAKRKLEAKLDQMNEKQDNTAIEFIQKSTVNIKEESYEQQKIIVNAVIDKVHVTEEEMRIDWKFNKHI